MYFPPLQVAVSISDLSTEQACLLRQSEFERKHAYEHIWYYKQMFFCSTVDRNVARTHPIPLLAPVTTAVGIFGFSEKCYVRMCASFVEKLTNERKLQEMEA